MEMIREADVGGSSYTAVDLGQFRNTQVGEGYQAKHVVRQKTVPSHNTTHPPVINKVDTKIPYNEEGISSRPLKKKRGSIEQEAEKYIRCEGIRDFRRELERILALAAAEQT
jgi:hypothetical protein